MRKQNLQSLVAQVINGNIDSFGRIYDSLVDRLYRFVYFRVGERKDAEDLTEEIFLKVFKKIKDYREKKNIPFEAWFFRIARNKVIDYYRTKKKDLPIDYAREIEDKENGPEKKTIIKLAYDEVIKKLRDIRSAYQEIIIFKFIEEKDNSEISEILNKPISHIRVLQNRALKSLRKVLKIKEYERSIKNNVKKFKRSHLREFKSITQKINKSQIIEAY